MYKPTTIIQNRHYKLKYKQKPQRISFSCKALLIRIICNTIQTQSLIDC